MATLEKHEPKRFGMLNSCLVCFRPISDPIHDLTPKITGFTTQESEPVALDVLNATTPTGLTKETFEQTVGSFDVFRPVSDPTRDPGPFPGENEFIADPVSLDKQEEISKADPNCKGHTCPACHKDWFHNYACGRPIDSQGLCIQCAQQDAVIVNRPTEIEQIAQLSSTVLSGADRAGIIVEHTSTVYLLTHDDNNSLKENWQELLHEHIRNIEQIIEKLRIKQLNTRKIINDISAQELIKLSPEERAQYMRDAAKAAKNKDKEKSTTEKKPKTEKVIDAKEAYAKMIKDLMTSVRRRRPAANDDEIRRIAEKQYELQKSMEDSL